ncbi:MAG: CpsD/CapB family tyrosine-protein kinase [Clostridia bacterium]|nr:CpsD/CapB family tyrosine-protein kinase [Clostridia bacterium]
MNLFGFNKKKTTLSEEDSQEYILNDETPFNVREAFNTLRTNVVFGMAPSGGKSLLITSANQSEGKSTTSVNLSVVLAQNGAKVLLIDADLRKPKLHKFFGTDYTHGLSRFLIGQESLNDSLFRTSIKGLDLMTSGVIPPNPSELLGSNRMKVFLEKAEEYYDYIIVDTPPINVVTDAAVLSKYTSAVLIVVHYGSTNRDDFQKAKNQLRIVGANVIGFSVVGVRSERKGYYKKYRAYNGYSEYGYGEKPKEKRGSESGGEGETA